LLFLDNYLSFKGMLLNNSEECFAVSGRVVDTTDTENNFPSTSQSIMNISVVDGETGDKYFVRDVPFKFISKTHEVTGIVQHWIEIDHPAIKFKTEDLLIGNRADVEINQFIDPNLTACTASKRKARVHLGSMTLNLVAMERHDPTSRRMSSCVNFETIVIDQADDFFV
jgi:hypothetical protein